MRLDMASSQHSTFTEKRPVWSVSGEGRLTANAIAFLLLILEGGEKYASYMTKLSNIQMDLKDAFFTSYGLP